MHIHVDDNKWLDDLKSSKSELETLRENKLTCNLIQSQAQHVDSNEEPSKFFLNLENNNFVSKHIRELKKGELSIQKPEEILSEMFSFYQKRYRDVPTSDMMDSHKFRNITNNIPCLNDS